MRAPGRIRPPRGDSWWRRRLAARRGERQPEACGIGAPAALAAFTRRSQPVCRVRAGYASRTGPWAHKPCTSPDWCLPWRPMAASGKHTPLLSSTPHPPIQVLAQILQAQLAAVTGPDPDGQQQQADGSGAAGGVGGCGRGASQHDAALQQLAVRPGLRGKLLGRLQHVLCLSSPDAAVPVNSVLQVRRWRGCPNKQQVRHTVSPSSKSMSCGVWRLPPALANSNSLMIIRPSCAGVLQLGHDPSDVRQARRKPGAGREGAV